MPLPDPLEPLAIEIHESFETAVHAQPPPAVTATVPLPPSAATSSLAGAIANVHGACWTPACDTVKARPPTTMAACRDAVEVLSETVN